MSVKTELTRLEQAKSSLKTSIENKGTTIPSDTKLDRYPDYVDSLNVLEFVKVVNATESGTSQYGFVIITEDLNSGGLFFATVNPGETRTVVKGSLIFVPSVTDDKVLTNGTISFVKEIWDWPPYGYSGSVYKITGDGYIRILPYGRSISDSEALSIITGGTTV